MTDITRYAEGKNENVQCHNVNISGDCKLLEKEEEGVNMRAPAPFFQRYEFPVLAEDPSSISKARTDPLACNVNNDAVLIWNDVIVDHNGRDALPGNSASLPESSIEDVFQDLQSTALAYNGVSCRISNGDGIDGVDGENLKEHLHDLHRRRHRHDPPHHRHGLKQEDAVVSRRRMYEQGVDLPYISKLNSGSSIEHCNVDNLYFNSSRCPLLTSKKSERVENEKTIEYENEYSIETCDRSSNLGETELAALASKTCDVINDGDVVDAREVVLLRKPWRDNTNNNRKENVCEDFRDENAEEFGGERSYLDSGHFEDISGELLSPYRSSTGSEVFIENDNRNCTKYTEDNGSCDLNGDVGYEGEQCISQRDIHSERSVRSEKYSIHDDSEVFVEDGKNIDTMDESRESHLIRSRNRHERSRGHRDKLQHKTRTKSKKKQPGCNASEEDGLLHWKDVASVMVQCANESCEKASSLVEARKWYKNCHHCLRTYYCSRGCRREDWGRHKERGLCHGSRVSSACKKVIGHCNTNPEIKAVLSRLALRGYLSHGRGCVMLGFPDLESTDEFLEFGFPMLELNPIYVSAKELSESKMYGNILEKLLETCRLYKPDIKFVLNVGVGLRFNKEDFLSFSWLHQGNQYCYRNQNHEEMDTFESQGTDLGYGSLSSNLNVSSPSTPKNREKFWFMFDNSSQRSPSSRHKAPILQKFIKLKLSPVNAQQDHEKRWTFEKHFWDEFRTAGPTLILTGIPERSGADVDQSESKKRQLTFINIQRKLRERNVNLRCQYPSVHAHLIAYVTHGIHFPSQVLFPVDAKTGRTFTCFMMPEAEAELEWMQSHHLLNDLELSKDSLNKSMSKTLSFSMPSLCPKSRRAARATTDGSRLGSSVECIQELTRKPRSASLNRASSSHNLIEQPTHDDPSILRSKDDGNYRKKHSPEMIVNDSNSEAAKKSNTEESNIVDAPPNPMPLGNGADLIPPLDIQGSMNDSKSLVDEVSDRVNENSDGVLCENRQEEWAASLGVTPSFYPVRKARNVKLYAHDKHSKPSSVESPTKPRLKPWQLSVDIDSSLSFAPLSSSPSSAAALSSTPSALSPMLYTSTPKSTKPPDFESVFVSNSSPSLNNSSPTQHTHYNLISCHQNASHYDDANLPIKCPCCEICRSEMNYGCPVANSTTTKEYGFDSCYRNKVVVDEVDQMKRRRKDRKSKCELTSSISPVQCQHPLNRDVEYHWFESGALQSPPLATSTMERRRNEDGDFRDNERSARHSKRKTKQKGRENNNYRGDGNNQIRDRGCEYDSRAAYDAHPFFVDSNDESYFSGHGGNSKYVLFSSNGHAMTSTSCSSRRSHVNGDKDISKNKSNEICMERSCDVCASDCQNDRGDLNVKHNSANFRRRCNTNYFLDDFRISKLPANSNTHSDNQDCDFNHDGIYEILIEHNKGHGSISHVKTRASSKDRDGFTLSTNHFVPNNTDHGNTITNATPKSSPDTLDNTRKALIPKRSLCNHSNDNNNNAMTSSMPDNRHYSPPDHHCHHQHRHHHGPLDTFENVTHHSANQTQVSPYLQEPSSNPNSSKRKIKFDLPNPDASSLLSLSSNYPSHSHQERPKQSCLPVRHQRNRKTKHSVSFEMDSDNNNNNNNTKPTNDRPHNTTCQIIPAINISYSSDW